MVSAPEVSARLEELARDGVAVRLDLSELAFMDSTGVRVIYTASRALQENGGGAQNVKPKGGAGGAPGVTRAPPVPPLPDWAPRPPPRPPPNGLVGPAARGAAGP